MKRWEPLGIQDNGIWQDDALGCFTEDAVLLAHFMRVRPDDCVLDLGTGNGILCIYGSLLYGGSYVGIDVNAEQIALARASAESNGQSRVSFQVLDVKDAMQTFGTGTFSVCVCNPPYYTSGDKSRNVSRAVARHADTGLLDSFFETAFQLLHNGGKLYLCFPAEQLVTVLCTLRAHRMEPKTLRVVKSGDKARLLLIKAKKLAKPGICME